jgi:ubiquitin C-terminal hydrolase
LDVAVLKKPEIQSKETENKKLSVQDDWLPPGITKKESSKTKKKIKKK